MLGGISFSERMPAIVSSQQACDEQGYYGGARTDAQRLFATEIELLADDGRPRHHDRTAIDDDVLVLQDRLVELLVKVEIALLVALVARRRAVHRRQRLVEVAVLMCSARG